jgi:hypothetical protein
VVQLRTDLLGDLDEQTRQGALALVEAMTGDGEEAPSGSNPDSG